LARPVAWRIDRRAARGSGPVDPILGPAAFSTRTSFYFLRSSQSIPRVKVSTCSSNGVRPRILSDNHHLAMDSIPQELIDAIIDNVPQFSLPFCSLVAKRWRRKSQQHVLRTISLSSEGKVKRWCTDVPQDSGGISSYVRHVTIKEIYFWTEPALLSRFLGSLSSLTKLSMYRIKIPDEFPGHISRGEFGKGITTLDLCSPRCALATLTSMILSLSDLKEVRLEDCDATPEGPPPTYSVTPQRGPLDSLKLYGGVDNIGEALAKFRFTSRRLYSDVDITSLGQLLLLSSETVVKLKLYGVWSLWILRPSREDNDRSYRNFIQWGSPSHPPTTVVRPYHSSYQPLYA